MLHRFATVVYVTCQVLGYGLIVLGGYLERINENGSWIISLFGIPFILFGWAVRYIITGKK